MNTLFVLGAPDPEMAATQLLLSHHNIPTRPAMSGGKRVNPASAYRADPPSDMARFDYIATVECNIGLAVDHQIDHHNPGDPGFGLPPADFWRASSIGQVWDWLGARAMVGGDPPHDLLLTAAADHCLGAAYRGECPGIDPEALARWREESRAAHQRITPDALRGRIEAARVALRGLPHTEIAGFTFADASGIDIPELPEASARDDIMVQYTLPSGGRTKIGVLNGSPEALTAWMEYARQHYRDIYGDPARGFAGAYL